MTHTGHKLKAITAPVALAAILLPFHASGQFAAAKRLTSETADHLLFTIWADPPTVYSGRDIKIQFRVENHGDKPIYLVQDKDLQVVAERGEIRVQAPYPFDIGHGQYDYTFTKVGRGRTHQGNADYP